MRKLAQTGGKFGIKSNKIDANTTGENELGRDLAQPSGISRKIARVAIPEDKPKYLGLSEGMATSAILPK